MYPEFTTSAWGRGQYYVLLAHSDGTVVAIDQQTHAAYRVGSNGIQLLWARDESGSPPVLSALLSGNFVLVVRGADMRAINLQNGLETWRFEALGAVGSVANSPVADARIDWVAQADDVSVWVAISTPEGQSVSQVPKQWLLRIAVGDASILSSIPLSAYTRFGSVDEAGRIFVSADDGVLSRLGQLDPNSGSLSWARQADGLIRPMSVFGGQVLASGDQVHGYSLAGDEWLLPIHPTASCGGNGAVDVTSVTDGRAVWIKASDEDGRNSLYGLDALKGRVRWSVPLEAATQPILTSQGTVVVVEQLPAPTSLGNKAWLREFDQYGNEVMKCPLALWNELMGEPVIADGRIIYGVQAGMVLWYSLPGRAEAAHAWSNGAGNSRRNHRVQ